MLTTNRWSATLWAVALALLTWFGAGCSSSDESGGTDTTPPAPTLSAISVAPKSASMAKGTTQQLTATGTYSDSSTKDLTTQVTWSSSDEAVAKVDSTETKGLVTAVAKGSATITATMVENGKTTSGGTTLSVTDAAIKSVAIGPANPAIAKGTVAELTATATFDDESTQDVTASATWVSSDESVATVSKGVATGLAKGTATITATVLTVSGTATLKVSDAVLGSIDVTSPDPWIAKGKTEQFTATGHFSDDTTQDLTRQVTWASSDESVTISNAAGSKGEATAVDVGSATISATMLGVTGTKTFYVSAAALDTLVVTPIRASIAKGTAARFVATGILSDGSFLDLSQFATWSSSDESVAKVSNDDGARGTATGLAAGEATIGAQFGAKSGTAALTVTAATVLDVQLSPLNPSVAKGLSIQLFAIARFSDGTAQDVTEAASWGTADAEVATVSNNAGLRGRVLAMQPGSATITATFAGKNASTTVSVTAATLLSITVTPPDASVAKGMTRQFAATAVFSDLTTYDATHWVTWSSSAPSVATVDANGVAKGVVEGSVTIEARMETKSGTASLTVTAATLVSIGVTPPNPSIAKGTSIAFQATGVYSDESTADLTDVVTWTSDDASVSVSNAPLWHGTAFGIVEGSATVTATLGDRSGSTKLTVTAATLVSVAIDPATATIAKGTWIKFWAIGTYTDNSTQDLSASASWSSSGPAAWVTNGPWSFGLAYGSGQGTATITAAVGDKVGTATLTVTAATLGSLAIDPSTASLPKGTAKAFQVVGTYSDGSSQDLTDAATWSSSDPTKLIVSNVEGSHGLATAVSPGSATLTASFGGKSATASVEVTAATLASISVSPAGRTIEPNRTLQLAAWGSYTDNSTVDVTNVVTWSSSDETVAIVSNAAGSRGLATGVAPGQTTITASLGGKSSSTGLTVAEP